jgi:uncharacterized repeat protein (TIGR03803 family)
MKRLDGWKRASVLILVCAVTAMSPAQTFTDLIDFNNTNGGFPFYMAMVQGVDGNLYGTTLGGGSAGSGTVFRLTPQGKLTTLYSFCSKSNCTDGVSPYSGLVQATDGNFYGTTSRGGANTFGTVFRITLGGKLTTLYSFCSQPNCTDGWLPYGPLVQGTDGNFYGTTFFGGPGSPNHGTVFKITPAGAFTTLYNFCPQSGCADGAYPSAGLLQYTDGNFYGTTSDGGTNGDGTVFKITPGGNLTTLHSFDGTDGAIPDAGLMVAANGNFYSTTSRGGSSDGGGVFEITAEGNLTTLYSFCSPPLCSDGEYPTAGLVQAPGGDFYGTTSIDGANGAGNFGTVFKITALGALTTLYNFCSQPNCADGVEPYGGLVQSTNGTFYGTNYEGGDLSCDPPYGCGTIYSVNTGLGPFVRTLPSDGVVGAEIGILGTNLAGATGVSFNGTSAKFTVRLPSLILTHVPTGATSGEIKVTLPGGTLSSNLPFFVVK